MLVMNCFLAILLAACCFPGLSVPPIGIEPPPDLPQPKWVDMVDRRAADELLAGYMTPREIKLEIVAENRALTHAGSVCFGNDGNLLLLEWPPEALAQAKEVTDILSYRDGSRRSITRLGTPIKDRLRSIPNPSDKGAFDQGKVILEEECLSAILPYGNWLYTATAGSVQRHRRSRNDGPFDVKEPVARGFGGLGLRPPEGLALDFDGRLLIAVGAGDHDVEGSDGSRARITGSGAIFRCRPDGSQLEALALGICDPQGGPVLDSEFHIFQLDGGDDSQTNSRRHLLNIAEGSDFGFRLAPGSHGDCDDSARRLCLKDLPGEMAPIYTTERAASGGGCVLNDSSFPPFMQGFFLCPDSAGQCVRAFKLDRRDSSFAVTEEFNLLSSKDPHFQPWQVFVGPGGAIYVTERLMPATIALQSAPKREGRLYRLTWEGGPAHPALPTRPLSSWSRVASQGGMDLVKSLAAADFSDRRIAQQELIRRGALNEAALTRAVGNAELSTDARVLALGALASMWDDQIKTVLIKLATDDDAILRRLAAECLGRNSAKSDPQVQEALLNVLGDAEPVSRRSVALAMARVAAPDAAECLTTALTFDIGSDPYLRDGLVRALERLGKPGLERLLTLANSGEPDRLELAVASWSSLRLPLALELLPQLLNNPHLQTEQRVRLIRSLARYQVDHPRAFVPILRALAQQSRAEPEIWMAVLDVARARYARKTGGFVRLGSALAPW